MTDRDERKRFAKEWWDKENPGRDMEHAEHEGMIETLAEFIDAYAAARDAREKEGRRLLMRWKAQPNVERSLWEETCIHLAGHPATEDPGAKCYRCGLPYEDPAFEDLIVPDDVWLAISPTGDFGGLLCPNCICAAVREKFEGKVVEARFMSGPFCPTIHHEFTPRPGDMLAPRRTTEPAPEEREGRHLCDDCGSELQDDSIFCPRCGDSEGSCTG